MIINKEHAEYAWKLDEEEYRLSLLYTLEYCDTLLAKFVQHWYQQYLLSIREQYNIKYHKSVPSPFSLFKIRFNSFAPNYTQIQIFFGNLFALSNFFQDPMEKFVLSGSANLLGQRLWLLSFIFTLLSLRFHKPKMRCMKPCHVSLMRIFLLSQLWSPHQKLRQLRLPRLSLLNLLTRRVIIRSLDLGICKIPRRGGKTVERGHLQHRCPDPVGRPLLKSKINMPLGAGMTWSDLILFITVYMLILKPVKRWGRFCLPVGDEAG